MPTFGWVLIVTGGLLLPIISVAYLRLRVGVRRTQLVNLFTLEGILQRYLAVRGRPPQQQRDESADQYRARLKTEFDRVFRLEFGQEYSLRHYVVPIIMASLVTAGAMAFLVAKAFGIPLRTDTPAPVFYAVLGAVFWSIWVVTRGYTETDLTPATFYWVVFRYILAVAYGSLAGEIFTPSLASLGAFVAATLPFGESVRLLRSRVGSQWTPAEGHPKLDKIQGLDSSTIERLEELGVHTTQELAFSDPLNLLLRSNFSPKVLIDWMDQAFLYNYVGEKITDLALRGIRGATEMADVANVEPVEKAAGLRQSIGAVLAVSDNDVGNLIRTLYNDNQLRLIWEVWGGFEEPDQQGEANA